MGLYWHETEWYKYIFTHVHDEALYQTTWDKLVDMAARRTMPSPRVIRPGNLAETYLPKHILFPLPPDKQPKPKQKDKPKPKQKDDVATKKSVKKTA